MKKDYISPKITIKELYIKNHMLESSYTDIGGTTDGFEAKSNGSIFDYEEDF